MKVTDKRYSCYPFMKEKKNIVDFEIRTDSLASHIGLAASFLEDEIDLHTDLIYLTEMAYHLNGSVRGKQAIHEERLAELNRLYEKYRDEAGDLPAFLLPHGHTAAMYLHIARSEAKKSVRALYKASLDKEVPELLFDYTNLLANVLFLMAVRTNQLKGYEGKEFVSESYNVKKGIRQK
ncbi:ATP:cob(I)alamin adenosyltransferase [Bacillus piscicola]|uniref:ATP:cob(I)alamin adenosyltransferase n=1 Tax=Bacillus piscicola TaxID=1632684 RepID=UPI001F09E794|nr:ATP:cob(I)alamin adenosyltransferase [Bacillus piscicola]